MRYISVFSGIEAASVAWEQLGWEPVAFSEIDAFPSAVLATRFPNVPNLGDITKVDWSPYKGKVDLVVGGSPCFVAGTLVLCESGFKPIEDIVVGERVVTHKGRLKRVLATGGKIADTITLKGQGSTGIECTPNHPFYSRSKDRVWDNSVRSWKSVTSDAEWTPASEMGGRYWLNVCSVENLGIPPFGKFGKGERGNGYIEEFEFTPEFFYFVGRWLGDGWANAHHRKERVKSLMKRVYVCCSHDEADSLQKRLDETGLHFGKTDNGSTVRFTCSSTQLYDWIVGNFGVHADGKNIPAWCFGMDKRFRTAMLAGYLDADGTVVSNGYRSTTINRKLSLGIKMLAGSCDMASSVTHQSNERVAVIEGRHVNERPNYVSSHYTNSRSAFFADCGYYGLVRKVEPSQKNVRVYNLEVEDDNSYTADAVAVHNCQSFSIAGKREGLAGASGLMWEYIRCVQEVMPSWFVWENVPGALTSERGRAFAQLLDSLDELGFGLAWRILDAQFVRVPGRGGWIGPVAQRRRRVFLVGHLGDMRACEVLFEPESLRWDNPSSREKRQALARAAGRGAAPGGGEGGCLTPWDAQAKRVFTEGAVGPCLNSGADTNNTHIQPTVLQSVGFKFHQGSGAGNIGFEGEQSPTLTTDWHQPAVITNTGDDLAKTLTTEYDGSITMDGRGPNMCSYAVRTANTGANGCGISEECAHTVDTTGPEATAYAFKVRCGGGEYVKWDGSRGTAGRGALCDDQTAYTVAATQDQYLCVQEPMVMASAHTNAEIGEGGVAPSLIAHNQKQPPAVVMEVPSDG